MIKVEDIMTEEVLSLTKEDSLADARHMMMNNAIRHIPITNDLNEITGLISQRDVLAAEESSILSLPRETRLEREKSIKIEAFYHTQITTISPKASVLKAALYMQKHKIGSLPVTLDNKLVGMVTDSDFINVAINLLEMSHESE